MEFAIEILLSIIISIIIIFNPIIEILKVKENRKEKIKKYRLEFIAFIIVLLGALIRFIGLTYFPKGLNPDEASSAYEAWSILNYGVDRNGKALPVFLISWGSGQNALYTYILIPFIKIWGLTEFATRLPMAIISSISMVIIYYIFKDLYNKKSGIIATLFLAICPWHIMKSRYGLESNIFPDIILFATMFLIKFLKTENIKYLYLGSLILGFSAYAYGTSYFFLPFFILPLLIYLIVNKKICIKNAIISLSIITVIALPIITMVIINTFNLPEVKLGVFTIPRCIQNRYEEMTSIFSGDFIVKNTMINLKSSLKILIFQHDNEYWHAMPIFGIYYLFSMPFTILGIIESLENKKNKSKFAVINFWFVSSILMLFIVTPNIVRINIVWIPIIMYTVAGIIYFIDESKSRKYIIIYIYLIAFICFGIIYLNTNFKYPMFIDNAKEVFQYLDNKDKKIYMQYSFKEPYIFAMFYNKLNPETFYNTAQFFEENEIFGNVKSIDKYNFYLPEEIVKESNNIYVIKENTKLDIDKNDFKITEINGYLILE